MIPILLLLLTSLIGAAGLRWGTPRPRAQDAWGILAVAPIFVLVTFVVMYR